MQRSCLKKGMMFSITKHITLRDGSFFLNNEKATKIEEGANFKEISKKLYQSLEVDYPKFYKMDNLSKTAFLSSELLLDAHTFNCEEEKIGLFISNKASSLETDEAYYSKTFGEDEFQANPALFVYTLPNIMMGELCIRHKIKGEQSMWVSDNLDATFVSKYVNLLYSEKLIESAIVGWVDFYKDEPEVMLCLVENNTDNKAIAFNETNLINIYQRLKS